MSKRGKVSFEGKLSAVLQWQEGKASQTELARRYHIHESSVQGWIRNYESMGVDGLKNDGRNKSYSSSLKETAVQEYLSGQASQSEICKRYQIRSKKQLQDWIMLYTAHKELRAYGERRSRNIMTKGRKTTFEERIEIVSYCIAQGNDYASVMEKYGVSYQQIYSWVRKYESQGSEGLKDRRGKSKAEEEMTEIERLRAENKLLAAKNKRLELEARVLKKLKELEGMGY